MKTLKFAFIAIVLASTTFGSYVLGHKNGYEIAVQVTRETEHPQLIKETEMRTALTVMRSIALACQTASVFNFVFPKRVTPLYKCSLLKTEPSPQEFPVIKPREDEVTI